LVSQLLVRGNRRLWCRPIRQASRVFGGRFSSLLSDWRLFDCRLFGGWLVVGRLFDSHIRILNSSQQFLRDSQVAFRSH
jgi:hypothetical protein